MAQGKQTILTRAILAKSLMVAAADMAVKRGVYGIATGKSRSMLMVANLCRA
jgi:hypothetical protein